MRVLSAKTKFRIALVLLLFAFAESLFSQEIIHKKLISYTLNDGLSNSHITSIVQDKKGFIWIGTEDGLNRFDGKKFVNFYHFANDTGSLPSSGIYSLHIDKNKNLWIGTFTGLCRYDYKLEKFIKYPIKNKDKEYHIPVKAISSNNKKELWLGTSGQGLVKMNTNSRLCTFFKHSPKDSTTIASDFISELLIDKNNNIWVGNQLKGVSALNSKTNCFSHYNEENSKLINNNVLSLFEDKNGNIRIGTFGGGISVINPKTDNIKHHTTKDKNSIINNDIVYDIIQDRKGIIRMGTEGGGLNSYINDNSQIDAVTTESKSIKGLINNKIRVIFEDKDGNLWLGIHQGGLNIMSNKPADFQHITTGEASSPVLSIFADNQKIWIGTDGNGLKTWNTQTNQFKTYTISPEKKSLKSNVIRTIYKDRYNTVWIGTYLGGLAKYNKEKDNFTNFSHTPGDSNSLTNNDVTAITEDRLGNLWIGTNGGGLNLYNPENKNFRSFRHIEGEKKSLINDWIVCMYLDRLGFVWIGTYWGISKLDPLKLTFTNFNIKETQRNTTLCFHEDKLGNLWTGTTNGLLLLNKETGEILKTYTLRDGLPNNVINGILEDNSGNLWLSTNNGISCFNLKNKTFNNYSQRAGLQSSEFIHGAYAEGVNNDFFFGGIEGITRFFPEKISKNTSKPKVILTDFKILNQSVKIGKDKDKFTLSKSISETQKLELPYRHNSFSFEFTAIEFLTPEKIKYAYQMEGFDKQWNYFDYKRNNVTYTNLDYGKYTFRIKASNSNGQWGKPTNLKITITTPVWLRWWAYAIYSLLGLIAAWFIRKYYNKRIEEKNNIRIERLNRKKDKELNETKLQFFTNISHEFRTPLTLIIGPLEAFLESEDLKPEQKRQFELMHRNANRLLRLVNQLMDLRKIDAGKVNLNAGKYNIIAFLQEIYDNFFKLAEKRKVNFYFKKDFSELDLWFDNDKLDKVFFNLLSNAFKFTSQNESIFIEIKRSEKDGFIRIDVKDTGKGIKKQKLSYVFDRFYQAENHSNLQQGTGIGLWLTKHYIELHKGNISVKSEPEKGTIFTILLPTGDKHLTPEQKTVQNEIESQLQAPIIESEQEFSFNSENFSYSQKKQSILLVEDDDEIRSYIKQGLEKNFRVSEAINGKEGLNKALETSPDLVITDVMMPEMDGIQLCEKLKTDLKTCHIPVIMLTAKTSIEHRIKGLETGADSYIPKPFNPQHLMVRIVKLLELRRRLINKFSNEIGFKAEKTAVTSADEKLLNSVIEIVNKKIADADLNVEILSKQIGMSRGHLQRKLKSLTGQNPNEFIRIMRLQQAAEILKNNKISISEAAYMVGFSSPSYFSTCFTKQYKISPKQFVEQNNPE